MTAPLDVARNHNALAEQSLHEERPVEQHAASQNLIVSPELVLVDPALAQLARALLPEDAATTVPGNGASGRGVDVSTSRARTFAGARVARENAKSNAAAPSPKQLEPLAGTPRGLTSAEIDEERPVERHAASQSFIVSPELVLVDPVLAQLARALLPEGAPTVPGNGAAGHGVDASTSRARTFADARVAGENAEWTRARLSPKRLERGAATLGALTPAEGTADVETLLREARRPQSRLAAAAYVLSVATAVLILVFVGLGRDVTRVSDARTRVSDARVSAGSAANRSAEQPAGTSAPRRTARPNRPRKTARRGRSQPRRVNTQTARPQTARRRGPTVRRPRRNARQRVATPPPNVLGVVVTAAEGVVSLRWAPPPRSDHVVVLREREVSVRGKTAYGDRKVVYRGTANAVKDRGVKSGVAYRYVVINYDRPGNASSGVPTIVVPR